MRELREPTVLITGATSGIGYATAEGLARLGARVVMVSRDARRGEDARQRLIQTTGSDRLDVVSADLDSLQSVRRLVATFLDRYERLDVLINNAGRIEPKRRLSANGIEMTFAVNVVAPYLLTTLLLDRLRASAPARIVNVSSAAHQRATIDLDDLQFERRRYRMMRAYGQSKLALNLVTAELARRLDGSGVTANALHPGTVGSNFGNKGALLGLGWAVIKRFMISPTAGATTSIYLATASEVAGVSGGYFVEQHPARPNPLAEDPILAARLWVILAALTRPEATA